MRSSAHLRILIWLLLLSSSTAQAENYAPDIREFSVADDLDFPGNPAFAFDTQSTLELWAAAGWMKDPGYDPVLVYHADSDGFIFVLAMLGDRSGLSLQTDQGSDELSFSFSDGKLHHIALISLEEITVLLIDGQVRGSFALKIPDRSGETIRIGSAPGPQASFIGAIGGIRLWEIAVQRETLINYALRDIFNGDDPHPDLDALKAHSDLHNAAINLASTPEENP